MAIQGGGSAGERLVQTVYAAVANLGIEGFAVVGHEAYASDHDVVHLPLIGCLLHRIIDAHRLGTELLDLGLDG